HRRLKPCPASCGLSGRFCQALRRHHFGGNLHNAPRSRGRTRAQRQPVHRQHHPRLIRECARGRARR
ncbi:Hypothetical protein SCLAV_1755, partial [Streptomyces clavuligerus]